jgi:hypothetical protein
MNHTENGYEVKCIQSGQAKQYGPTINEYHVKDTTGQRTQVEIREYCTTHVRRADDPPTHPLLTHLMTFESLGAGVYRYVCGHEYTG